MLYLLQLTVTTLLFQAPISQSSWKYLTCVVSVSVGK
uniref:Uncharacterized protein n=1 Tax=Arundo donax TaxID=35708 RepID=A0A0A9FAB3_ARUDO